MNNQRRELLLGFTAIGTIVMMLILAYLFGKNTVVPFSGDYKIYVWFDSAPGITVNSPVLKNGLQIGRVIEVNFIEDDTIIEVVLQIQKDRKIYDDEECRIKTALIMGDSSIEFVKIKHTGERKQITAATGPIKGVTPTDMMKVISNAEEKVTEAIDNVSEAARNLSSLMHRINNIVGTEDELKAKQEQFSNLIVEARTAMQTYNKLGKDLGSIVSDPEVQAGMRQIAKDTPDAIAEIKKVTENANLVIIDLKTTVEKASGSIEKIDGTFAKAEKNLDNLSVFTDHLKDRGNEAIDHVADSAKKLETFFDELTQLLNAVSSSEGPLQQMLNDPQLFNDIQRTITNSREITERIKPLIQDAQPIMHNVNVMTDKLAREPFKLGLPGMLDRSPPTKGLPKGANCFGQGYMSSSSGMFGNLRTPSNEIRYPFDMSGFDEDGYPLYETEDQVEIHASSRNVPRIPRNVMLDRTYTGPPHKRLVQVERDNWFSKLWPFAKNEYRYETVRPPAVIAIENAERRNRQQYAPVIETAPQGYPFPQSVTSLNDAQSEMYAMEPVQQKYAQNVPDVKEISYGNIGISFEPEETQSVAVQEKSLALNVPNRKTETIISFEPEPHTASRVASNPAPARVSTAPAPSIAFNPEPTKTATAPEKQHVPPRSNPRYLLPKY